MSYSGEEEIILIEMIMTTWLWFYLVYLSILRNILFFFCFCWTLWCTQNNNSIVCPSVSAGCKAFSWSGTIYPAEENSWRTLGQHESFRRRRWRRWQWRFRRRWRRRGNHSYTQLPNHLLSICPGEPSQQVPILSSFLCGLWWQQKNPLVLVMFFKPFKQSRRHLIGLLLKSS